MPSLPGSQRPGFVRRRVHEKFAQIRAEGIAQGLAQAKRARDPKRYRYVFVVTYGRSGSTLVQGLVNTLPRTLLRGENDLFVLPLMRSLISVEQWKVDHAEHGAYDDTSAFYGLNALQPKVFLQSINDIVTQCLVGRFDPADYDVVGFKEVLWHRIEPGEQAAFFDAMDRAFPSARYLLNTRDPDHAVRSGFWKKTDEDEARALIARVAEIQEFLRTSRPDRSLDVEYEVLTGQDAAAQEAALRSMAEFVLQRPADEAVLADMRATLAKGHGPRAFERADQGGARPQPD